MCGALQLKSATHHLQTLYQPTHARSAPAPAYTIYRRRTREVYQSMSTNNKQTKSPHKAKLAQVTLLEISSLLAIVFARSSPYEIRRVILVTSMYSSHVSDGEVLKIVLPYLSQLSFIIEKLVKNDRKLSCD